jgi:hypothetical protein
VSHQLDQIAELCSHAILLERGRIAAQGSPAECIRRYLGQGAPAAAADNDTDPVRFTSFTIDQPAPYRPGQRVKVRLRGETRATWEPRSEIVGIRLKTQSGLHLFSSGCDRFQITLPSESPFELEIDLELNMSGGSYMLDAMVWHHHRGREAVSGPVLLVQIADEEMTQVGPTFLNARGRLVSAKGTAAVPEPPARVLTS